MNQSLKQFKVVQKDLDALKHKVDSLVYDLELPEILEKIELYKKRNKGKKVTTAWLQRRFQIGYAAAARLLDIVNKK